MPHYKLFGSGRPDFKADEMILSRNEETGEPEHVLSARWAREIPEELIDDARKFAGKFGFHVEKVEPEEGEDLRLAPSEQPEQATVGADAASAGPVVTKTGESSSEIDQQGAQQQAGRAAQQDTAGEAGPTSTGNPPGPTGGSASTPAGPSAPAGTPTPTPNQ